MVKATLRGLCMAAFFAVVVWALIPVYVPRPAFIPGFAPPPDFWPRAVSIAGLALGLISASMALMGKTPPLNVEEIQEGTEPVRVLILRFVAALMALAAFVVLTEYLGFLLAAMVLTAATILLTGERRLLVWAGFCAVVVPLALQLFFSKALGTQFPPGLLFH
ncbi:tripartite tricarboxylate transporter TctB family protein [Paracoccus saliphilus]|uniref:Tripartite tricarboxylate transporter TctB family protein n=1 Tax=Paracoccus saliphilus TaxID=405559 RepID=A0AA45W0T7_9RHOB|nr:tripartite tricarboxylate transporter TctB family protein [Paracoccus saliphilus]WCR03294.1 tripartite tricarboxylate transporter TctB family protein [Paracoccus saliphilus]SIS50916.1 Tripartite tricarboxylate transporter TctB family protein [Paracoccus saliphilus]